MQLMNKWRSSFESRNFLTRMLFFGYLPNRTGELESCQSLEEQPRYWQRVGNLYVLQDPRPFLILSCLRNCQYLSTLPFWALQLRKTCPNILASLQILKISWLILEARKSQEMPSKGGEVFDGFTHSNKADSLIWDMCKVPYNWVGKL